VALQGVGDALTLEPRAARAARSTFRRNNSGSLAKLVAERRPGSSSQYPSAYPVASRTMKWASVSSAVQDGGKRRRLISSSLLRLGASRQVPLDTQQSARPERYASRDASSFSPTHGRVDLALKLLEPLRRFG
jgi:hypothetical protein